MVVHVLDDPCAVFHGCELERKHGESQARLHVWVLIAQVQRSDFQDPRGDLPAEPGPTRLQHRGGDFDSEVTGGCTELDDERCDGRPLAAAEIDHSRA